MEDENRLFAIDAMYVHHSMGWVNVFALNMNQELILIFQMVLRLNVLAFCAFLSILIFYQRKETNLTCFPLYGHCEPSCFHRELGKLWKGLAIVKQL